MIKKFSSLLLALLISLQTIAIVPQTGYATPVSYTHLDVYKRQFLPAYWYVKANEVVYTGAENRELLISYGVMIIITLGVLGLNIVLKKRKPILE